MCLQNFKLKIITALLEQLKKPHSNSASDLPALTRVLRAGFGLIKPGVLQESSYLEASSRVYSHALVDKALSEHILLV